MARYFGFEPDVKDFYFISYFSKSDSRIAPIARALHDGGVPLWYDRGLFGAKEWKTQISEKIRLCRAVIVFVTKELIYSDDSYVLNEVDIAKARGKSIYAVFLDDDFDQSCVNDKLINFLVEMRGLHGVWAAKGESSLSVAKRVADMLDVPFDLGKAKGVPFSADKPSTKTAVIEEKPTPKPIEKAAEKEKPIEKASTAKSAEQKPPAVHTVTNSAVARSAPVTAPKNSPNMNVGKKKLPMIIAAVCAVAVLAVVGVVFLGGAENDDYTADGDTEQVDYVEIGGERYSKDITKLDLTYESIDDFSPISEFTELETLVLYCRHITNTDLTFLKNLHSLKRLSIKRAAGAKIIDITALSECTNLTHIELDDCGIGDLSPLENLTNLAYLDLSSNNISDISALKNLTNLTYLDLSRNNISDISALENMLSLTKLYLDKNSISDISALENLNNLAYLYLCSNSISDISALKGLTNLTKLYFRWNNISDISALENLTNLTHLYLWGNPLNEDQVQALRKKLPNCGIV